MEEIIIGRNPVLEALKSGREVTKLMIAKGAEGSVKKIYGIARDRGVTVQNVDRSVLDKLSKGANHQGTAAFVSDYIYYEVDDILRDASEKGEYPFIIVLDGIEDPHNLGAVIRTADAAGVHGIIIPKRRAVTVTAAVEKAAAGAAEYVKIARVTNIARTVELLKKENIWTAAADMSGQLYTETDLTGPLAIVTGGEGSGVSRIVRETCDLVISIPMRGGVSSLNASNAAAVLMYEALRQRR